MSQSRRSFLKNSCQLLGATAAAGVIGDLGMMAAAAPAVQSGDYKALICVFLFGGNDASNTLIPYSQSDYNSYATARSILTIPRTQLLPITPATTDGRDFALHPSLPELQTLFAQKKLAVVANVGPLLAPTTRQQYLNESVPLPPQLFSHNDQQVHWQTSWPDEIARTGWGGRMADAINSLNPNGQISMSISLDGSNIFQVGRQVFPYMVSGEGPLDLWYYNEAWDYPGTNITKAFLNASYNNLLEKTYSETFKKAIENSKKLSALLQAAPVLKTIFPDKNDLAKQLKMAAKLMSIRHQLGLSRQIFFCSIDGFDTHGEQLTTHASLLSQLSQALKSFYDATTELGIADQVTTFTSSDFGRTYKTNGKGSDHGWGGNHFVMGGAVKGGDIYGKIPVLSINGPDDSGDGRWIPTIATEEYGATLAQWFGVPGSDLSAVFPNIGRFAKTNLGFMS
jgi:uncharacterized protein (DUF1501 family)